MLGTQTRGGRMVGADESTKPWRHCCLLFLLSIPTWNGFNFCTLESEKKQKDSTTLLLPDQNSRKRDKEKKGRKSDTPCCFLVAENGRHFLDKKLTFQTGLEWKHFLLSYFILLLSILFCVQVIFCASGQFIVAQQIVKLHNWLWLVRVLVFYFDDLSSNPATFNND